MNLNEINILEHDIRYARPFRKTATYVSIPETAETDRLQKTGLDKPLPLNCQKQWYALERWC